MIAIEQHLRLRVNKKYQHKSVWTSQQRLCSLEAMGVWPMVFWHVLPQWPSHLDWHVWLMSYSMCIYMWFYVYLYVKERSNINLMDCLAADMSWDLRRDAVCEIRADISTDASSGSVRILCALTFSLTFFPTCIYTIDKLCAVGGRFGSQHTV